MPRNKYAWDRQGTAMPRQKGPKRPAYFNQGKRLDPQTETKRFRDLLSVNSLESLLTIKGKTGEKAN